MAAAQKIPDELLAQIKKDGFVLAPVGGSGYQDLIKRWKNAREESYGGCVFVPLRSL
jgi:protein-L-isoaspartate O-methyltransferase